MKEKYDFSGWATRNDILCSDGRTIRRGAFKGNDGTVVPLVWNHQHNGPDNVLGHALLENRDQGVYAYCSFNNTEKAQDAKEAVRHGDVNALSIFANRLEQHGGNVMHGVIREVSLVLAGANKGATIQSVMIHGEMSDEEAVIYNGEDELRLSHAMKKEAIDDDSEYNDDEYDEEEEVEDASNEDLEELDENDSKSLEHKKKKRGCNSMRHAYNDYEEEENIEEAEGEDTGNYEESPDLEHADDATVEDIFNSLTDEQKTVVYAIIGQAIDDAKGESMQHADSEEDDENETVGDVFNTLTEKQKTVVYALIAQALDNAKNDEGETDMKHNVFDPEFDNETNTLSHAEMVAIFDEAKRNGSLKDTILKHGIEQIDYLYPDAQATSNTPDFIQRDQEWVSVFNEGTGHTPFARVKSIHANLTEAEARAKGYVKGNMKYEEVISLLKRRTDPTTVYKKQSIDRDDEIDITDFDTAAWLKGEMRVMLNEELARAKLFGDGRDISSDDKIDEQRIRPVWTDADLYSIKKVIPLSSTATDDQKAKSFIRTTVKARKDYKGSGNLTLFVGDDMLTNMLLMEDSQGRVIYDTVDKLTTALRVKKIVTVPFMDDLTREVDGVTRKLMGIALDLKDYNVGTDKGGEVNLFDDFDIDFNKKKYLIETRCSGALTKPYSAIVIEMTYAIGLTVDAESPSTTVLGKTVSELQTGVVVNDDFISGTLKYVTNYTGFSGDVEEQSGNFLALKFGDTDGAVTKIQLLGGKNPNPVTLDSDMNAVLRITNKATQRLKVFTTLNGETVTRIFSLTSLKCLNA